MIFLRVDVVEEAPIGEWEECRKVEGEPWAYCSAAAGLVEARSEDVCGER